MQTPDELVESMVLLCFRTAPAWTLTELLQANERLSRSLEGGAPDAEETRRFNEAFTAALGRLVQRGLVVDDIGTYSLTPLGVAEEERRHEAGVAARAKQGSTPQARARVLRLLGSSGTLDDVIARSKDEDGFPIEEDWAKLNLAELVARGEVVEDDGRYRPA